MIKRDLGKTGIKVSEVAFGGVEIGIPYGIGVETADEMITEAEAIKLLHASFDGGINFYDTARQYGKSESIMGKAFKDRRDKVILCTKCTHFLNASNQVPEYGILKTIMEHSLRESLHALQTDYVDVFMLHQGNQEILGNEDVGRILLEFKKSGLIRATGVSTYDLKETEQAIVTEMYDVIQLPFNLLDQRHASLFPLASQKGVGIVVRSVLMKGLLSDRRKGLHPALRDVEMHIQAYDQLLSASTRDLSKLATQFALSFSEVSSILVGLDRLEYLYKCLDAARAEYLDDKTLMKAKALGYKDPAFLNLHKWSQMGWLK